MDRAMRRNIDKIEQKYPQELEIIKQRERKSVERLMNITEEDIYKLLRENRIGAERAGKITNEIMSEISEGESK